MAHVAQSVRCGLRSLPAGMLRSMADTMKSDQDLFIFSIDSLTPETLPLVRLIQYLEKLAVLFGSKESVHLLEVKHGSAAPAFYIEREAAPVVLQRLRLVGAPDAPPEVAKAFQDVNEFLREDNAVGGLRGPGGAQILQFPGRLEPADQEAWVTEHGAVEGLLVRLGGKDRTSHATLEVEPGCYQILTLTRDMARQLAPHLYGEEIRVIGTGKWKRTSAGVWKLERFNVERFELAPRGDLAVAMDQLAAVKGDAWREVDDPLEELLRLRRGE